MGKIYIDIHIKLVLLPNYKPPATVMYHDAGHNFDLKISMNIWTRMDVVMAEYGIFYQMLYLKMCFF